MLKNTVIILDRDGVINFDSKDFIKNVDEWKPIPGSLEAIVELSQRGARIFIATNQSGLGRGLFDELALSKIHEKLLFEVKKKGGKIEGIVYCPHRPEENCACRKPKPGLFFQLAEQYNLDLRSTYAVGDSWRDIEAAMAAGCKPILVKTGNGLKTFQEQDTYSILVCEDLSDVARRLQCNEEIMKLDQSTEQPSRMRSAILFIGMVVSACIHSILVLFTHWTPYKKRYPVLIWWARFVLWLSRRVCHLNYTVEGRENIPQDGRAVILLSTHESTWEIFALQVTFPAQCPVVKKELLKIPLFGWGLSMMNPIALDRDDPTNALKKLIDDGKNRLDQGCWITLFPQGTRVPAGEEGKFNLGAAALAVETGYPILPVAHNAGDFWPRRSFLKKPGTIKMKIGPLIETKGMPARQIHRQYKDWIMTARREMLK